MRLKSLEKNVKKHTKRLEIFFTIFLLRNIFNKSIRRTKHFQEWLIEPMNYVRLLELPITLELLDIKNSDEILDISSPKLLSLYLAHKKNKITISDSNDYFLSDFNIYKNQLPLEFETLIFDATDNKIKDKTFDKIYSVSVMEHIPEDGDVKMLLEIERILKTNGSVVITVPANHQYLEEWVSDKHFYWNTKYQNGKYFYQKRYNKEAFEKLVSKTSLKIDTICYLAEKPIVPPYLTKEGYLFHNFFKINESINALTTKYPILKKTPFIKYFYQRRASLKYHYITADHDDMNIRQLIIKLIH